MTNYKIQPLRPLTSPTELRDATVRDYVAGARASGQPVDMAAIYRQAIHDLEMVEQYKRGNDLTKRRGRKQKPKRRAQAQAQALATSPDDLAVRVDTPSAPVERGVKQRNRIVHGNPMRTDPKWAHAMGRIRRIVAGASAQQGKSLLAVTETAECPELALRFLRMHASYLTRARMCNQCKDRCAHSPFYGLSERDAARMYMAETMNICDSSSGKLGPWWVPK